MPMKSTVPRKIVVGTQKSTEERGTSLLLGRAVRNSAPGEAVRLDGGLPTAVSGVSYFSIPFVRIHPVTFEAR